MSLMDIVSTLERYSGGASANNPPASAQEDFSTVAQAAPQSQIASGLSQAFQSNQTAPFPQMIGQLFNQSNGQQKAGILNQLLASAGPNVGSLLAGGLGGGLAGTLGSLMGGGSHVTEEQAQQIPTESVQQLAEHSQKNDPSIVDKASGFYAQHPQVVQALGAGALAMIMSHVSSLQR